MNFKKLGLESGSAKKIILKTTMAASNTEIVQCIYNNNQASFILCRGKQIEPNLDKINLNERVTLEPSLRV